jgi:hypothetical protein
MLVKTESHGVGERKIRRFEGGSHRRSSYREPELF